MKLNRNLLSEAVRFGLVAGAVGVVGLTAAPAFAQDSGNEEAATLSRVTVTGSRIRRVDAETSQPVFVMNRADIDAQGLTSIGDVIQNLAANGSTLNSTFNNGGNGETRVSLRNLGSNRTLVLVNGRRWVGGTGLGGAVDLNTIPAAAVERIEVLKDGASTIYGSDAIAGVVNIILRTDYEGAEFNSFDGQFYNNGNTDGERQSFDFMVGSKSDRTSVMFGAQYVKEDPVFAGDRAISAEPLAGTGNFFGSSTTPFGRFQICADPDVQNAECASADRVRPDGSAGQFTYDPGQSGLNYRPWNGNTDAFNFAPLNYLLTPQERYSIFSSGQFEITDNIRFTTSASYNNRRSEQLLAAMPVVLGTVARGNSGSIQISKDSIFNPFGAPVVRIQRRAVETGGRSFSQDVDTFQFTGALEGEFQFADRYFYWDAGYTYAKNKSNDKTDGLFNVLALRQALGPSMLVNGNPICVTEAGNAASVINGCVPLNLLGADGSITPEMLAFSTFQAHDQLQFEMLDYFANISGDLFELPGGMAAFAFGVEHRRESGFDRPDALIATGNTTGNSRTPTAGQTTVDEGYLELSLPLLKDLPFAKELTISLATRISDYDGIPSTTRSKFGLQWKPFDDLLVRANWSQGFRAPSISELFTGIADNFPQIQDPCNTTSFPNLPANQQQACIAQGVPNGGADQPNTQIQTQVGGNPNLKPETAVTRTLGMVYSPSYLPGFDLSIDWWKIHIGNIIGGVGAQRILDNCIQSLNTDPNTCPLFSRLPDGTIDRLLDASINGGFSDTEGYDLTLNYVLPENSLGRFSFTWDTTYLADIDDEFGTEVGVYTTFNNNWRIRSNLTARWEKGDFGATWFARYFSHQTEDCQFLVDYGIAEFTALCSNPDRQIGDGVGGLQAAAENKIGATTYHDATVYWNTPWNGKVTVGVNNVFDRDPPFSVQAFANSFDPQYEVPGRFLYLRYNQRF